MVGIARDDDDDGVNDATDIHTTRKELRPSGDGVRDRPSQTAHVNGAPRTSTHLHTEVVHKNAAEELVARRKRGEQKRYISPHKCIRPAAF